MSDYNTKRLAGFALCLAAVFGITALFYGVQSGKYERYITASGESALSVLISSTEQMQQGLKNMQYGTDGVSLTMSAAQVYSSGQTAKAALSSLPVSDAHLMQYEKLLNQASEYALSLMAGDAGGTAVTEEHISALKSLNDAMEKATSAVASAKESIDSGDMCMGGIISSRGLCTLSEKLAELEEDFPEYTKLNYDGGYSEHMETLSPLYLNNMTEVNPLNALHTAAEIMGIKAEDLPLVYETEGTLPVYGYGDGSTWVEITKTGGIVLSFHNERQVNSSNLSEDEARQLALQYAEKLGFSDLKCRYAFEEDNILTLELIASYNNVAYYPDRVTIGVALDNGQALFLNGRDYIMSHTERQLTLPETIPEGASLALIPTDGQKEHLCFEYVEDDHLRFVCTESGTCFAVYAFDEGEKDGLITD